MESTYSVFQVRVHESGSRDLYQMEVEIGKDVPEGWTIDRLSLDYDGKVNAQMETNATLSKQLADATIKNAMMQKQMTQLTIKVAALESGE